MLLRLKQQFHRPVPWGATLLSYIGIIVVFALSSAQAGDRRAEIEEEARARDAGISRVVREMDRKSEHQDKELCMVVVNVHENAKFRARTEQQRVEATVDYLRDTAREEDDNHDTDSSALRDRVKANLPLARADARQAKANVAATRPPAFCDALDKK